MKVKVEFCWSDGGYYWRTVRTSKIPRLSIPTEDNRWNRSTASKMLDLIETETGIDRQNIRFDHV